ncbi:lil3 protein [Corchorus olitorius]|uniref:Lil3 protein n=1 Tax=Corchorus olitorius TaxID=93759 RepID=A0A1R3L4B1_9ROSI|nr:lil3 protein [Corchorus olitorius]
MMNGARWVNGGLDLPKQEKGGHVGWCSSMLTEGPAWQLRWQYHM